MAFIKINKHNFFHNLNQLALKAGSKEKLAVVLKDNAYGHGIELMASLASEFGIRQAVVISIDEAERIEKFFEHILILNDIPIKHDKFSFAVTELEHLKSVEPSAAIELKIDTGMHRNGILMDQIDEATGIIRERGLNTIGVMTHYRSADVLGSELSWQKKNFEAVKQRFRDEDFCIRFHSHNSVALLRSNNFDEDIARVGIAIYGYNELPSVYDGIDLKPVLSLYARQVSTRSLKKGQRIGYGGDYTAPKGMIVSTYDIGYGDGWMRGDSLDPYITAEGLPLLGRVSMDFVSLETDEDIVCIMDNAQIAAEHFGTISYEITTRLSHLLKRVIG